LACGGDIDYDQLLSSCLVPEQLPGTILLGVDLPWDLGTAEVRACTLPALLESHALAGAFTSGAFLSWDESPSSFAGPKDLMPEFRTNCMKAAQSEGYCNWFAASGATMSEFLSTFLPALDRRLRRLT
jgi:hypothetical protein